MWCTMHCTYALVYGPYSMDMDIRRRCVALLDFQAVISCLCCTDDVFQLCIIFFLNGREEMKEKREYDYPGDTAREGASWRKRSEEIPQSTKKHIKY